ncbi:phosphatase PAP2 family protein [Candidatus Parcubacteria bacterium]|nr:phosphatase PAP2 family protein [Candidatus Parcubacteria bacterium]
MFPNWAKNILFLLVYMISGLILAIIIEGLTSGSDLTPLNTVVQGLIVSLRTPLVTTLVVFLTQFGNPFVLACVALLIAVILFVRGNAYDAALFLAAMGVALVSLTVLKNFFQISRPVSDVYKAEGWSFPSGHATIATAFFFMICVTFFNKLKTIQSRVILIVASVIGTLIICFTRLYLGAHWALDVLAGIALGVLSVSFTVLLFSIFLEGNRSLRKKLNL